MGFIPWEPESEGMRDEISSFRKYGFRPLPKTVKGELRQALVYFRNCLELYDMIVDDKLFTIEELYERSLVEGPAFTKYIKKCRAYSLQAKISLDEVYEYDYAFEEYSGYDSIYHERYLPNWDDTATTCDWVYSLLEEDPIDEEYVKDAFKEYLRKIDFDPKLEQDITRVIESVGSKKTSLNDREGKTTLLKNAWGAGETGNPWYAVRRIVPTTSGSTRDTGVPDIDTLVHIKVILKHVRRIAEQDIHSANCPLMDLEKKESRG